MEQRIEDERWMEEALTLAGMAEEAGDVPVGALVVREGRVLGRGFNRREAACDPTAHAEVLALREAAETDGIWRLDGATSVRYPGAVPHVRGRYRQLDESRGSFSGPKTPKAGPAALCSTFPRTPRVNHRVPITSGVMAEESGAMLRAFFEERRRIAREARQAAR